MTLDEEIKAAIADTKGSLNLSDARFGVVPGQWHRHLIFWPGVVAIVLGKEGKNETADLMMSSVAHVIRVELTRMEIDPEALMQARIRGQAAEDERNTVTVSGLLPLPTRGKSPKKTD